MSLYTIVLFLHVCGDVGIFIGLGAQLLSLAALWRAQSVGQVRAIVWLIPISDLIGIISALLTIATGLYMTLTVWGLQTGWIAVALASLILFLPPLIGGIIEPRTRVIVALAGETPDGLLPNAKRHLMAWIASTITKPKLADLGKTDGLLAVLYSKDQPYLCTKTLDQRIHDPVLSAALQMMAALLFGLIFLMTIKPSLIDSIIAMTIALMLGLASSLLFWRIQRRQGKIRM